MNMPEYMNYNQFALPRITLFDIYPSNLKTYVHTKTCTRMLTVSLFIIA
jgi:hypothetical protein